MENGDGDGRWRLRLECRELALASLGDGGDGDGDGIECFACLKGDGIGAGDEMALRSFGMGMDIRNAG